MSRCWATVTGAHAITYAFANDPVRAIAAAAGSGGYTDTIGSIAGAIAGARYGLAPLSARWIDHLRGHELVDAAIDACTVALP